VIPAGAAAANYAGPQPRIPVVAYILVTLIIHTKSASFPQAFAQTPLRSFPIKLSDATEAQCQSRSKTCGMTTPAVDALRVAYGVVWHAGGIPQPGRLRVGPDSLRLIDYNEPGKVLAELALDDLAAIKLPASAKGRRVIVLESRHGEWIEIESAVDRWILPDLLERAITHLLATTDQRLLVSIALHPGDLRHAPEIVRGDTPLWTLPASVHDVFILRDKVLLLFDPDDQETPADPTKLWDIIGSWHELIVEIGIAEHFHGPNGLGS
jgi:hypothetical protein